MSIDLHSLPEWVFPLLAFCLADYFLVLVVRRLVEALKPSLVPSVPWRKVVRTMPALFGGIAAAFMYKYPYLSTLPTWGTRFIYGAFAGGLSAFAYMLVKAVIQKYFGVKIDGDSISPPAMKNDDDVPTQELPKLRGTGYSDPGSQPDSGETK